MRQSERETENFTVSSASFCHEGIFGSLSALKNLTGQEKPTPFQLLTDEAKLVNNDFL